MQRIFSSLAKVALNTCYDSCKVQTKVVSSVDCWLMVMSKTLRSPSMHPAKILVLSLITVANTKEIYDSYTVSVVVTDTS